MRKRLAIIAGFIVALIGATSANAACRLSPEQLVNSNNYFKERMIKAPSKDGDRSVAYTHIDDPRMVVNLSFDRADPVGHTTRSAYVTRLDEFAGFMVDKAKSQGRWAEKSVHPQDPVASVVVEETKIDTVGDALVGHMEALFTPECILTADFVSPSSQNLRSRWIQMAQEITNLRTTASYLVIPIDWEQEDTSPKGWTAVVAGLGTPLLVIVLIAALLGRLRELDPPSAYTKIVLGVNAILVVSTLLYQRSAYMPSLSESFGAIKYLDSLLLLLMVGGLCIAGALLNQVAARIGLIAACVGGFALIVASYLRWTPDANIGYVVGISMIFMGALAYVAWSQASLARKK